MPPLRRILLFLVLLASAAAPARAEPVAIESGGLTLSGELRLAPGTRLADGVVLMVHGTMAHHGMEIMTSLQALLAERGRSSLAITLSLGRDDRRGFEDCQGVQTHRQTDAIAEIDAWRSWLSAQGAGPTVLLGHSRGGNQVARAAARSDAQGLAAVMLLAPMTWSDERVARAYAERAGRPLEGVLAQAAALAPDETLRGVPFLSCPDAEVRADSFLSYYRDDGRNDTPSLLGEIAAPTLVIAAENDAVVVDLPDRVAPRLDDDTQLVVIAGADHMFLEFFAEDAADAIADFLEARG